MLLCFTSFSLFFWWDLWQRGTAKRPHPSIGNSPTNSLYSIDGEPTFQKTLKPNHNFEQPVEQERFLKCYPFSGLDRSSSFDNNAVKRFDTSSTTFTAARTILSTCQRYSMMFGMTSWWLRAFLMWKEGNVWFLSWNLLVLLIFDCSNRQRCQDVLCKTRINWICLASWKQVMLCGGDVLESFNATKPNGERLWTDDEVEAWLFSHICHIYNVGVWSTGLGLVLDALYEVSWRFKFL